MKQRLLIFYFIVFLKIIVMSVTKMSFFVLIFVADKSYGNTTSYKEMFLQMILRMDFIIKIFLSFFFVFCVAKNENPKMSKNGKNEENMFSKKSYGNKMKIIFFVAIP